MQNTLIIRSPVKFLVFFQNPRVFQGCFTNCQIGDEHIGGRTQSFEAQKHRQDQCVPHKRNNTQHGVDQDGRQLKIFDFLCDIHNFIIFLS